MSEPGDSHPNDDSANHVTAPVTPPVTGEAPTPDDKAKSRFPVKYRIIGGVAALVLIGAGTAVGIAAANTAKGPAHAAASARPSHSAKATPSAAPTSAANTPIPAVTPVEMPPELKIYQDMDVDTFKNIPEDERIKYWAQIVAGNDGIRAFAADYYRVSGDPRDKLPETISENNTPQEIATIIAYGQRVPFSLTGEDRQKALLAGLYTGELSNLWQSGNNALTADPEGESGGSVAYNEIVDPFTATSTSGVQHANNETYIDLELKSDDGNTSEARAYFLTTEYNGQPVSWWVIQ